MNGLISSETYKISKDKSLKIMSVVLIIISIFLVGIVYVIFNFGDIFNTKINIHEIETSMEEAKALYSEYGLENIFNMIPSSYTEFVDGFLAGKAPTGLLVPFKIILYDMFQVMLCMSIFAGLFVASSFEKGTIRNAIAAGKRKATYYICSLASVSFAGILFMCVTVVTFTLFYYVFFGIGPIPEADVAMRYINILLFKMLYILAYSSIFVMVAFCIRNAAGALGLSIILLLGESSLAQTFAVLPVKLLNVISSFMPKMLNTQIMQIADGNLLLLDYLLLVAVPIGILLVTTTIGIYSFNKRDI